MLACLRISAANSTDRSAGHVAKKTRRISHRTWPAFRQLALALQETRQRFVSSHEIPFRGKLQERARVFSEPAEEPD